MAFSFIFINAIFSQGENKKFTNTAKDLDGFLDTVAGKQRS